jgi:hypothetical protein
MSWLSALCRCTDSSSRWHWRSPTRLSLMKANETCLLCHPKCSPLVQSHRVNAFRLFSCNIATIVLVIMSHTVSPNLRSPNNLSSATLHDDTHISEAPKGSPYTESYAERASPVPQPLWSEWAADTSKEIVPNHPGPGWEVVGKYEALNTEVNTKRDTAYTDTDLAEYQSTKPRRRLCGCLPLWPAIIAIGFALLILALGLGAGLGLKATNKKNSE